jgi:beta-ribofuranosylaminobenzene 5'-phosphate synthase
MTVVVRAFPRLHMALLDLGHATPRRYGGIGVTLNGPILEVSAHSSDRNRVEAADALLDERALLDLDRIVSGAISEEALPTTCILVQRMPPQHVGLGSKTALLLATLTALTESTGKQLSKERIVQLSGRGGTSGIGVNSFFRGGFIADAGHPDDPNRPLMPSSASLPRHPPPILVSLATPSEWEFQLFLPDGHRYSGGAEVKFFETHTPVDKDETYKAIALAYHGVAAAFAAKDLPLLRMSLAAIHQLAFSRVMLAHQTLQVSATIEKLMQLKSVAVGMSSMGPLVYAIAERGQFAARDVEKICQATGASYLGAFAGRNYGHEITKIEQI